MAKAQEGSKVKVNYVGKLPSGEVFDTSENRGPIEFTIGQSEIISGFENAVSGMTVGESKTVTLKPEQAYGPHREDRVLEVPREKLPEDIDAQVGQPLEVRHQNGESTRVVISEVGSDSVKLDANHPLAGRDLVFELTLVDVA
jgi:FKBP-type peptidyl-prolyl cis-trans isomerase 2